MEHRVVNVLGTNYDVRIGVKIKQEPRLKECDGFTDFSTKSIIIGKFIPNNRTLGDLEKYTHTVFRHELIHAFLYESGLDTESWGRNEEIIDWIALQAPKLSSLFEANKIMDL